MNSFSCAPPAGSGEYTENWKTFSLCYFTKVPQIENVFEIMNILVFVIFTNKLSEREKIIVANLDSH